MGHLRRDRHLWYAMLVLLAVLPLIPGPLQGPFAQHVLVSILLFACMSQAWNILGGYCGQVSFGHSVFFGIGAYGTGMAVVTYGLTPWPGAIAGAFLAMIVAIAISYPCFRLKGHYFAIATFAIVEIFNRLFMVWDWVGGAMGLDYPIINEGWKNFMWFQSKTQYYYGAFILFLIIFSFVRWMETHKLGYYMKAVRDGQEAAESLGVNSTAVKLTAIGISAFLAALCGAFFVQYNLRVDPPMVMSLDMSMRFVLITILGGLGTLWGPLLGAAILIPLQEYTRAIWGGLGGGVDLIIFGILIIVIVIRQPKGVMGFISWLASRLRAAKGGDE